jgi:multiple sugar transport system ATP-binding protein
MGRAIVRDPQVFLFDEPLSNLDAKLRVQMRTEIKALHLRLKTTSIYVTHDQIEAMTMADQIVVMRDGVVEQRGRPLELYDHPCNLFVAGFIGSPSMNFLPCRRDANGLVVTGIEGASEVAIALSPDAGDRFRNAPQGTELVLGVRPEDVLLAHESKAGFQPAEVYVVEPLGSEKIINLRIAGHIVKARTPPTFAARAGETLFMQIDQTRSHLFDARSGDSQTRHGLGGN